VGCGYGGVGGGFGGGVKGMEFIGKGGWEEGDDVDCYVYQELKETTLTVKDSLVNCVSCVPLGCRTLGGFVLQSL
jgi:hypothetical protein